MTAIWITKEKKLAKLYLEEREATIGTLVNLFESDKLIKNK